MLASRAREMRVWRACRPPAKLSSSPGNVMGHLYALRGAYFHHVRLMLRKGAYWWFPFAYLPSVLVLSWIASRSDDPAVACRLRAGYHSAR